MSTLEFLTRTGQTCTPLRQEFILLSDILGVSALVDALNNPPVGNSTESSVLGPFFTEDAPDGTSSSFTVSFAESCGAVTSVVSIEFSLGSVLTVYFVFCHSEQW